MAALLLDTHIYLWLRGDPGKLTGAEIHAIETASIRHVSVVSLWEISLLIGLKRVGDDRRLFALPAGFELLPVTPQHCEALLGLPAIHRDPFDRMLIAQAQVEKLKLLSRDAKIAAY
jgi:PIN domain nuclease of toxin-antitoxin system